MKILVVHLCKDLAKNRLLMRDILSLNSYHEFDYSAVYYEYGSVITSLKNSVVYNKINLIDVYSVYD